MQIEIHSFHDFMIFASKLAWPWLFIGIMYIVIAVLGRWREKQWEKEEGREEDEAT